MQITFKEFCFKFGGKHNINAIVRPLECAIAEVFCMSGSRAILCPFVTVRKNHTIFKQNETLERLKRRDLKRLSVCLTRHNVFRSEFLSIRKASNTYGL